MEQEYDSMDSINVEQTFSARPRVGIGDTYVTFYVDEIIRDNVYQADSLDSNDMIEEVM